MLFYKVGPCKTLYFTPTLTPNRATALPARGAQVGFVGDAVTFTADATLHGNLKDKTKVSYANFKCDTSGTPTPKTLSATSFSCTYTTSGSKTATVSALYYNIPKTASAEVAVRSLSSLIVKTATPDCTEGAGMTKV